MVVVVLYSRYYKLFLLWCDKIYNQNILLSLIIIELIVSNNDEEEKKNIIIQEITSYTYFCSKQ